mgnify:CR=1 FL=1
MKKTLAAVAVLGAFASSAFAADVTLYGRLDTGLLMDDWSSTDVEGVKTDGTDWGMQSGNTTTSRIGVKGSEEISDGLTVGFVLETKISGDTGAAFGDGFDRESTVWMKTNYGTLWAGKIASIWSDGGSNGWWANMVPFTTSNAVGVGTNFMTIGDRAANRLSYRSPTFAGFTVYADYSFGTGVEDADRNVHYYENKTTDNRPASIGIGYANGGFSTGLVVQYTNEAKVAGGADPEDGVTVGLAGSYDFGVAKVYLAGNYYKDANTAGAMLGEDMLDLGQDFDQLKGYAVEAGVDVPAWGGLWTFGLAYADGEDDSDAAAKLEYTGYNAALMYSYPLSKRTNVYAGAGYTKVEGDADYSKAEYETTKAMLGLVHKF